MTDEKTSFRKAFIQEQQNHVDDVAEEAQRLVNLYRHADAFGDDFMPKVDEMLLAASPEVLTAMSNILGGQVVRRYCSYLKEKTMPEEQRIEKTEKIEKPVQKGYLPDPEKEILSFPTTGAGSGIDAGVLDILFKKFLEAHQEELSQLLKEQTETMSNLLQRFDKNTHEMASHQTDRLIDALQQEAGKQKQYADVIESTAQTPVLVPDEMEGF